MSDIAVKLENISKYYKLYNTPKDRLKEALHPFKRKYHRKFYALKNINLEIKKGEILGIVGRNGSGKSTLLKLISRVIQPCSGKIIVNGAVSALLELGAGLNPEFNGMQNIYFSGTMMGFSRKGMKEKVEDIAAFADIGDYIHQPLKTYSSGMKARLGFALAVNMDPKILVVDEVLAVGDELFRRKCFAKMEEFFKSGCTVLYVSHAINTINEICSRAIFIDGGQLVLEGIPNFVTEYYLKFMYAKPGSQAKIMDEIIQLNRDEEKKKVFVKKAEKTDKKINKESENKKQEGDKAEVRNQEPKPKDFYTPNFKPKTTVKDKNYDVDVYDIHISAKDGRKVNFLVKNEQYVYSYKVKFNIDAEKVSFGMTFKTQKGVVLTSAASSEMTEAIDFIKKGEEYLINWAFRCCLLRGTFYADIGLSSIIDGERVYLARISDALVFKVQDISSKGMYSIIDFGQYPTIQKL